MTRQDSYPRITGASVEEAPTAEASRGGDEVSLIDILTQLAYRKRLIAIVAGFAVLVGLILCFALPVRYTATAKIMPPQQTQSAASILMSQLAGSGAGSLAAMAGGGLGLKNPNDIYVGLLTSRPIADAIILDRRFELVTEYHAKDMTDARKKLAEYTGVVSEKNGFITVSVTDRNKKRAAEMANAYVEELRKLTKSLAVTEASQRRLFYEEQMKEAKESLVSAETAFEQVQQSKGLVALDAQSKAMIEGLAELRAKVSAKEVEVQTLRSYSTDRNPAVQLAERELSSMKDEVAHLEQRNHSSGFPNLGLEDVPSAGLEYLRAEHELKYRQTMFDLLIKQYDAAKLDEGKEAAVIQVVEPAIEPDRRSFPKRAPIIVLSAIIGFFSGSMLALMLWWKEIVIRDPDAAGQFEELHSALRGRNKAVS